MSSLRVLFVAHNHPAVRPGGAEAYSLELHQAFRARGFESLFLAKAGPPMWAGEAPEGGPIFSRVGGDNEWFLWTDLAGWDTLNGTFRNKKLYTTVFRDFLLEHRPDVVHLQHTAFLGYDMVRAARRFLPDAAIVYTLHELLPICHHHGQMVRTAGEELCERATPTACHGCFPDVTPAQFFRRSRFIQSQLSDVDLFVVPSELLHERFSEWGLGDRIRLEEYGRVAAKGSASHEPRGGRPTRLGFFGQVNPFKGLHVLLEAVARLDDPDVNLVVHGANLDLQRSAYRKTIASLAAELGDRVTFAGPYGHQELPELMSAVDWVTVPSIWWENSPLVIQEAFQHGRPVICSDIGGMAEKVADGVNGLHFPVGDAAALARVVKRAASTRELWARLQAGIPAVHSMETHVDTLLGWYGELLERRRSA